MRASYRVLRRPALWAAALAAAVGCDEPSSRASRTITGPITTDAAPIPLDDAIDPRDSYATADLQIIGTMTVTSDQPMVDPASGATVQTLTVDQPPDTLHFQTGFSGTGEVVASTHYPPDEDSPLDPRDVAKTRVIGGVAVDYDAAGNPVYDSEGEAETGIDPLAELPVMTGTMLLDALVPPKEWDSGSGDVSEPGDQEMAPEPSEALGGRAFPGASASAAGLSVAAPTGAESRISGARLPATAVERRSNGELRVVSEASSSSSNGRPAAKQRLGRTYRRTAMGRWVLTELDVEQNVVEGTQRIHQRQRVLITNVRHHENAEKDKARREAARAWLATAASRAATIRLAASPERGTLAQRARPSAGSFAPRSAVTASVVAAPFIAAAPFLAPAAAGAFGVNGLPACDPKVAARNSYRDATRAGLALQHGFLSNACTWQRMDQWIRQSYDTRLGGYVITNTPSLESYDLQADSLVNWIRWIDGPLRREWILVGHSNGGIVSRLAARKMYAATTGPRPRAVITINSPQQGAPAMNFAIDATAWTFRRLMRAFEFSCGGMPLMRGCGEYFMVTHSDSWPVLLSKFFGSKVYFEMRTDAQIRRTLNDAGPELGFAKVSLVSQAPRRWLVFRMYADSRCNPEEKVKCVGGREQAHRTNRLVKHLKKRVILGSLMTLTLALVDPWKAYEELEHTGVTFGRLAAILAVDRLWRNIVSKDAHSDGIVPVESQWYPNVPRDPRWYIPGADSHVGSPRSPFVQDYLFRALNRGLIPL
jgi:pimeloyl-ACP methyl ester carboxylesterase